MHGDVTEQLTHIDQDYVELLPDEWITLEFEAPPVNGEMERTFIFVSTGRYETIESQRMSAGNVAASVGVGDGSIDQNLPQEFEAYQNYPNPFNPTTIIRFGLPEERQVNLTIYSITGEKVVTLIDNPVQSGYHEVLWDGRNQNGTAVSSGIYVYMLQAGNDKVFKKMMLVG